MDVTVAILLHGAYFIIRLGCKSAFGAALLFDTLTI